jgi:hypothetical protein
MKNKFYWTFVISCLLYSSTILAESKILFEGYYIIKLQDVHVGYYIQRYELETKKKQFISTYFLRTNQQGGNISESLKAYSTEKLNPIKYQYTSLQDKTAKTIDANLRKNKKGQEILQIKTNENGKLRVSEQKLESGTFLSTFLIYLLLQGEKGIQPGVKYQFKSIAEEDGKVFPGEVYIESEEKKLGLDTFKILYTFKKTQFVNFINKQGESILSISPALGISAELVAKPEQATKNMVFNDKSIALLFGNVPKGNTNQLSKNEILPENPTQLKAKDDSLSKPTKSELKENNSSDSKQKNDE